MTLYLPYAGRVDTLRLAAEADTALFLHRPATVAENSRSAFLL
jgi:hypothetical protein